MTRLLERGVYRCENGSSIGATSRDVHIFLSLCTDLRIPGNSGRDESIGVSSGEIRLFGIP